MDWHDECRSLRAEGRTMRDIAVRLGVSETAVRIVLIPGAREQRRAYKQDYYGVRPLPRAKPQPVPRDIPLKISKEDKDAAILAFARGQIDRFELMRRITPRDKWRGRSTFQDYQSVEKAL
jgi:hypothetical protein